MHFLTMIDPLYSISGFGVGLLVGMTGVGGGSLMTPLLILLFGVHPATAVGTDLLYAAATKTGGSAVHGLARTIDWPMVRRLATGSIPATIVTLAVLSFLNLNSMAARSLITVVLCFALILTAGVLIFRKTILNYYHGRFPTLDPHKTALATVLVGAALGVLVSISSVGAGAIASWRWSSSIQTCRWRASSAPTSRMPCRSRLSPAWATGCSARWIGRSSVRC